MANSAHLLAETPPKTGPVSQTTFLWVLLAWAASAQALLQVPCSLLFIAPQVTPANVRRTLMTPCISMGHHPAITHVLPGEAGFPDGCLWDSNPLPNRKPLEGQPSGPASMASHRRSPPASCGQWQRGEGTPSPPSGCPAYAQPLSPRRKC